MKKGLKVLCLLILVLILQAALPMVTAHALQDGDFTYELNGSDAIVTGYTGAGGVVTIPAILGGYSVKEIGASAFASNTSITSVTIPDGVTSIGDRAFSSCYALASVNIPDGVISIGDGAFSACGDYLASINIPASVTSIGANAFGYCYALQSFSVAALNLNYESDSKGVLFNKGGDELIQYPLGRTGTDYTIPASVKMIDDFAFYYATRLVSITIDAVNLETIGERAFNRCDSLQTISELPAALMSIGDMAFAQCYELTELNVNGSNTVYSSADGVLFDYDKKTLIYYPLGNARESYAVPEGVETLGAYAFYEGRKLKDLTIPKSVKQIRETALDQCYTLTSISVDEDSNDFSSADGVLFDKDKTTLLKYPAGRTAASYVIPGTVNIIDTYAFSYCGRRYPYCTGNLTSITIPDSVATIRYNAFRFCEKLTNVTIPEHVSIIAAEAFSSCSLLTEATFRGGTPATFGASVFDNAASGFKIKYPAGWSGWSSPTWNGYSSEEYGCTVTFDSQYGSSVPGQRLYNKTVTRPADPTRTGYTFGGWHSDAACTADWDFAARKVLADTTLYAKWDLNLYSITYDLGGGAAANPPNYSIETPSFTLVNPAKSGYNFSGWSGTGISGTSVSVTIPAGSTGARAYTAHWEAQPQTCLLANVIPSSGSLNRGFSPTVTSYKITIGENDASFTLTAVKQYDGATMTMNKQARSSFTVSPANGKSAKISVKVTFAGKSKTYTFTVTRAKSTNNALASLSASAGTWSQPFDPNVTSYTLFLDENTKSTAIKAAAAAGKLAGVSPASSKVTLNNGAFKDVKITVKAQSGAKRIYTIHVQRAASTNADLKSLKAPGLSPGFSPGNTNYTITLPANKGSVSVSAKAAGYKAVVSVDGSGKSSKSVALANGETKTVPVVVTSQAGGTKVYMITVTRQ